MKTHDTTLNQRAQQVMKILVERYIYDGQPVGSTTLAKESNLALSSATIRNVLADLEAQGYLSSPHTSAGRIPTAKGYRVFIDSLLTVQPLDRQVVVECEQSLHPDMDQQKLLQSASTLLSKITRLVGVVSINQRTRMLLKHAEFLPLSGNRVLVILVLNGKEIQNRIIYTDRPYSASELEQAANYLSKHYVGYDLSHIRDEILSAMRADRYEADGLMGNVIDVVEKSFVEPEKSEAECLVAGKTNLLNWANDTSIDRLRDLFGAFHQKRDLLHLLDKCLATEGIQIFIGKESGHSAFTDYSVVTAPYATNDGVIGVLGVIGPTRMAYHSVIPIVDVTARLLTSALNQ